MTHFHFHSIIRTIANQITDTRRIHPPSQKKTKYIQMECCNQAMRNTRMLDLKNVSPSRWNVVHKNRAKWMGHVESFRLALIELYSIFAPAIAHDTLLNPDHVWMCPCCRIFAEIHFALLEFFSTQQFASVEVCRLHILNEIILITRNGTILGYFQRFVRFFAGCRQFHPITYQINQTNAKFHN